MLQDDKIRISTVRRNSNYQINPHFHRHNELYYLDEGKSKIFVDTKLYSLSAGSLVFIKRGRIHKTLSGDNNSHVRTVLMFPDSVISDITSLSDDSLNFENLNSMIIHVPELMRTYIKRKFKEVENELCSPDCMSEIMLKNTISELFIVMFRQYINQSYEFISKENTLDSVIQNAIEFICKNYSSRITLGSTAEFVNMSPTYFSKKFKRETGVGFKEYLCKYRLREAERMLKSDGFISITDVAARCGFSDSNYFATAFKSEYGVPPNKFRHLS